MRAWPCPPSCIHHRVDIGFQFGAPSQTPFQFGSPSITSTTAGAGMGTAGIQFGSLSSQGTAFGGTGSSGFQFGITSAPAANVASVSSATTAGGTGGLFPGSTPTPKFTLPFPATPTNQSTPATGFGVTPSATGFQLGAATSTGMTSGDVTSTPMSAVKFGFGTQPPSTNTATFPTSTGSLLQSATPSSSGPPSYGFGVSTQGNSSVAGSFPFSQAPATSAGTTQSLGFNAFGTQTTPLPSSTLFANNASSKTVTSGFTLGQGPAASTTVTATTTASVATPSLVPFSAGTVPSVTNATTSAFAVTSGSTSFSLAKTTGDSSATTTTSTIASTALPGAGVSALSFRQLEENINKWNNDLEEHVKLFLGQATQVNAWDQLLISNGEKISELNESLSRAKSDQERLENELDYIASQQREIEEILTPLEAAVAEPVPLNESHPADIQRQEMFQAALELDTRLSGMAEDLKEIIQVVNASATAKQEDSSTPLRQLAQILNAHMDSLQWIDHNCSQLQEQLDQLNHLVKGGLSLNSGIK
ncbi:unnamed protein product [Darwinula stevensoni]|uniref:Nucleoporin NSP1-like C-terminal domain-containing protein n=1 Tax=Darwinula stevensoni TaxID=69355 RepID=A0A7R8XEP8_9CRUS|nr:unnamed protein product [Darwinula stevensoni]CAG0896020.1 unnamed protein product [Darwinula stevensoni]